MTKQEHWLVVAMRERGVDDTHVAADTGIAVSLLRRYVAGAVNIGVKNGLKLSRYFGRPLEAVVSQAA